MKYYYFDALLIDLLVARGTTAAIGQLILVVSLNKLVLLKVYRWRKQSRSSIVKLVILEKISNSYPRHICD